MGVASDTMGGQVGAVAVLAICTVYLLLLAPQLK